jgi:hypothetical protein
MRKWGYGINSYCKTAHIYVDDAPWWIFALDRSIEFICDIIPSIPFPKVRMRLKDPDDIEFNESEWTTWKEWYGDLNQWFHLFAHCLVFEYCRDKMKSESVDITYDKAREMFYNSDRKFFDQQATIGDEIRAEESVTPSLLQPLP